MLAGKANISAPKPLEIGGPSKSCEREMVALWGARGYLGVSAMQGSESSAGKLLRSPRILDCDGWSSAELSACSSFHLLLAWAGFVQAP